MIPSVKPEDFKVSEYIVGEFGSLMGCDICKIYIPPIDSLIQIEEPLQTCPDSSNSSSVGLDENQCIPVGVYKISSWRPSTQGFRSTHFMSIEKIGEEIRRLVFCFGIEDLSSIDWRGAKKFVPDEGVADKT